MLHFHGEGSAPTRAGYRMQKSGNPEKARAMDEIGESRKQEYLLEDLGDLETFR